MTNDAEFLRYASNRRLRQIYKSLVKDWHYDVLNSYDALAETQKRNLRLIADEIEAREKRTPRT